jgi:dihydrofolate synthase/folylpolyglutamate synthase
MAIRAKVRQSSPRRATPVISAKSAKTRRTSRAEKPGHTPARKASTFSEPKPAVSGSNGYSRALRFLQTLSDYERLRIVRYNTQNFDLDRMRTLLKRLGNPQDSFRSIHIAGTKGKGSTCVMTEAMLRANGYKTGLYTSPHLVDIRERINVGGAMIPQADFARLVRMVEPIIGRMRPTPTYFDVLTAIAFKYFAEQKVQIAVVETGLGGRLDSTNVLRPEVTAITSISKDHMAQLGATVARIAEEKAGIFKPGIPAISAQQDPDVEATLRRVATANGTNLEVTGKEIEFSYRFESSRMLGPHNRICLFTPNSKFEHLAVPLMGEHQAINCGVALSIIDRLKTRGLAMNDNRSMEGLAKCEIPGRMEMVNQTPRVLVDGAHNAASLDAMMRAIGQYIPYDSMVVIFGCCSDKDVPGMLERVTHGADKVIFTKVDNIRSSDPNELAARYVELYGKMAQVAPTLEEALAIANRAVTKEDLICITGSLYLVGEAKKHFAAMEKLKHQQQLSLQHVMN